MKEKQEQSFRFEELSLNQEALQNYFYAAHTSWGGMNGGVIKDNVYYDLEKKVVVIRACGDLYEGQLKGIDRNGNLCGHNKRIGGCLVTKKYYGPGSFRFSARFPIQVGVCSAFWIYHYTEAYQDNKSYNQLGLEGLNKKGEPGNAHYIRNHQIDIEVPILSSKESDAGYKNIRFCTWRSFQEHTSTNVILKSGLNDGKFHEIRFDWHTEINDPRVEFYVNNKLEGINRNHVPDIAGRVWIGLWFPSKQDNFWAGKFANFSTEQLFIKKIEYLPFGDSNPCRHLPQTYQNWGLVSLSPHLK